ncbi:DUF4197 domain-containing protein [Moheibacter sediminis]|uniref:DUF4197 domain-containing protein n=1 Tax=Moheibacter sediminis TaxID=1434700 RepID=A0A1W2AGR0_9FLAO|nr:DUF4197 domain-containing protein [Moheibacter sediminis]SMC59885.1 Protein of unknown function [Moheibacter sediminis]
MKQKYLTIGFISLLSFSSCTELQQIATQIPTQTGGIAGVSSTRIAEGLKQALNFGIQEGITSLGKKDGFFGNSLTKILLPQELQKVDNTLRNIGLGSLADEGLKLLNRAAEDAVVEATPIFTNAITSMTFNDAKGILLGNDNAATNYLQRTTQTQLFSAFKPKIDNSLGKVGADKIWEQIIGKYNTFTGQSVNTDLNSYVTEQAINGVFKMVAQKEEGIRNNIGLRTTPLLQEIFALQD